MELPDLRLAQLFVIVHISIACPCTNEYKRNAKYFKLLKEIDLLMILIQSVGLYLYLLLWY